MLHDSSNAPPNPQWSRQIMGTPNAKAEEFSWHEKAETVNLIYRKKLDETAGT